MVIGRRVNEGIAVSLIREEGTAVPELGPDHSATKALARASITMTKVDLWHARLALRTLRLDQREAIAEAAEI